MDFKDYWRVNNGHTFAKSRLTKTEIRAVQQTIQDLQKEGLPSSKIIDALQKLNPEKLGPRWKAARAFWTEVKVDDTQAVGQVGEDVGFTRYEVLLSPNACAVCRAKSDNGRKKFTQEDIDKKGHGNIPPFHPNAVLPDTRAILPRLSKLFRARYTGHAIKVFLADGSELSVTENHMVLTSRGFVAAKLLREGDNVVSSATREGILKQNPDNDDRIATIEEVFNTAMETASMSTTSVPATAEHLHGDGRFCDGDIDVVSVDSFLGDTRETAPFKHVEQRTLRGIENALALSGSGNLHSVLIALAFATDGIVGRFGVPSVVLLRSLAVNNLEGLLDAARYDSRVKQSLSDGRTRDFETLRDTVLALPSEVRFDDIVRIERYPYHGYVYDAATASTLYTANGVVTSNCYCVLVPYD